MKADMKYDASFGVFVSRQKSQLSGVKESFALIPTVKKWEFCMYVCVAKG